MSGHVYIVGGGPAGLTLASELGALATVFEKAGKIGGTWAPSTEGEEEFTHHSPQIVNSSYVNTRAVFEKLPILKQFEHYFTKTSTGVTKVIFDNSDWSDRFWLSQGFLFRKRKKGEEQTVKEHFGGRLSAKCYLALDRICVLLDGLPADTLLVNELYDSFDATSLYQSREVRSYDFLEDWRAAAESRGAKFNTGVEVEGLELLPRGKILIVGPDVIVEKNDFVVLAVDALNLDRILGNSSHQLRARFGGDVELADKVMGAMYTSASFQLHFSKGRLPRSVVDAFPEAVKAGVGTDWGPVCLFVNPEIERHETILSCTLIERDRPSSYLGGKTVNDCASIQEIMDELLRQLKPHLGGVAPDLTTQGSTFEMGPQGDLVFSSSSSARAAAGDISPFGKDNASNLVIAGPTNPRSFPPTTMEVSVASGLVVGREIVNRMMTKTSKSHSSSSSKQFFHKATTPWRLSTVIVFVTLFILVTILATMILL
jgi:hypothetical protein